jgi:hypothetical protein
MAVAETGHILRTTGGKKRNFIFTLTDFRTLLAQCIWIAEANVLQLAQ